MDNIKLIQTGKCEILVLKVPEGASKFYIYEADWLQEEHSLHWRMPDNTDGELYFSDAQSEYEILGISTELTEEQWRGVLPIRKFRGFRGLYYEDYKGIRVFLASAKQSGISLLEANQCFSVNPIPQPEAQLDEQGNGGYCDTWVSKWQEAEYNTGKWLILKQL